MGKLAADCNIEWMIYDEAHRLDNHCFAGRIHKSKAL